MDLQLKQWRNQQHHESEQQTPAAKIPKLLFDQTQTAASAALPLFSSEPTSKISNMSGFSPDSNSRFPRMGSYFSLGQWQELELQALIYRYMLAGAAVPPELLQPIEKSLHQSTSYFLHHPLHHYSPNQPAWYWSRAAMDPEPGRCRRTDGKKWRCSRDVVAGHKYCERHMHRGRNRSRKPVESPTSNLTTPNPTTTASSLGGGGGGGGGNHRAAIIGGTAGAGQQPVGAVANGPNFFLSGSSPSSEVLHLNPNSTQCETENNRSDGHILRHFFDDWPRSLQESETAVSNASPMSSVTCLSISMPGNSSSDVSLKLSTGNEDEPNNNRDNNEREQPNLNWGARWGGNPMGGPLAEALRSSTSSSSPTSVLHQLPRGGIPS